MKILDLDNDKNNETQKDFRTILKESRECSECNISDDGTIKFCEEHSDDFEKFMGEVSIDQVDSIQ